MVKLLVAGAVHTPAALSALAARVSSLQSSKNGPFDAVLCPLLCAAPPPGSPPFPLPLYAVAGPGATPACSATTLLTGEGVVDVCGLRVAWVGGEGEGATTLDGVGGAPAIDALLSPSWPAGVATLVNPAELPTVTMTPGGGVVAGAAGVCEIARRLTPRYIFSPASADPVVGGGFFARAPYRNPTGPCTRFVSLARVTGEGEEGGGDGKGLFKSLHALGLTPGAAMPPAELTAPPPGVTENPYTAAALAAAARASSAPPALPSAKRPREGDGLSSERVAALAAEGARTGGPQAFWNVKRGTAGAGEYGRAPLPDAVPPGTECWFCLSEAHVEKHLIVAVGNECYLGAYQGGGVGGTTRVVRVRSRFLPPPHPQRSQRGVSTRPTSSSCPPATAPASPPPPPPCKPRWSGF